MGTVGTADPQKYYLSPEGNNHVPLLLSDSKTTFSRVYMRGMKPRVTIIQCQWPGCEIDVSVGPRGRIPRFCADHASAGRVAKHRAKNRESLNETPAARRQRFSNEKYARVNPAAFSFYYHSHETEFMMFHQRVTVALPTSELLEHTHPINEAPVQVSQPSVCGRDVDGELHLPKFEQATLAEIDQWTKAIGIAEEPDQTWLAKLGKATLSIAMLAGCEDAATDVDGIDVDDWWQHQLAVVESLNEDGTQAPTLEEIADAEVQEEEVEIDLEDESYEQATSALPLLIRLRVVEWWKKRNVAVKPCKMSRGRFPNGNYKHISMGGSRLDLRPFAREVRYPIGPSFTGDKCQSLHDIGLRWCSCVDCVATRKAMPVVDESEIVPVKRWKYTIVGGALVLLRPNVTLGYERWYYGGFNFTADRENPPKVVRDKYLFNRLNIRREVNEPELIRQGDVDVSMKWPEHLLFSVQKRWFVKHFRPMEHDRRKIHPSSEYFLYQCEVDLHAPEDRKKAKLIGPKKLYKALTISEIETCMNNS